MAATLHAPPTARFAGKSESFWIDTNPRTEYPPLQDGLSVDVAVIGGGIAGITAAVLLKRAGRSVALIEARHLAEQVSGKTTAKVTSQHGLIYDELIRNFGEATARGYADSNQAALDRVAAFVSENNIDCDFERRSSYVYTTSNDRLQQIEREVDAARQLGLPAFFVWETSLPFRIAGAVRFDDQAQFHPCKYLLGLARELEGAGAHVFENTRVTNVEDATPCRVTTDHGSLTARSVIVATNLPVVDRGGFFSRAYPYAHVALAAPIDADKAPDGMFISADPPTFSVRTTPAPDGGRMLICIGPQFKTGQADTEEKYRQLESWVRNRFQVRSIDYRWTNEDYNPADNLYYIGRMGPRSREVYVATGFKAWGMTGGTLAGMILSDLILDRPNPWADLYDPNRANVVQSAASFLGENANVALEWISNRFPGGRRDATDLPAGEAAVLRGQIAAYRREDGTIEAVSAVCTHMGCIVQWNAVDRTWDCPCHGSRFTTAGEVLHGPAIRPLEAKRVS